MSNNKPICFFFLIFCCLFFNLLVTIASAAELCYSSLCRRNEPLIRFPFRLQDRQPSNCGFPGFGLFCDAFNQTLIDLPNSGKFTVEAIDYAEQNLWLNDPGSCLPKRLLELNLTGSPFEGFFYQDFTLFNCTSDYRQYKFNPIGCLSGANYSVFATSSERIVKFLASTCRMVGTVAVAVQWEFFEPVGTSDLSENIRLAWRSPHCRRCESRGGQCGYRSDNSTAIECRNINHHGLSRGARYAITVGAGLSTLFCLLGLGCYLCSRFQRFSRWRHPILNFSVVVVPPASITNSGLDSPTIESYPKTILGESCQLPKPDDSICSICLSEYMPKETLRSIPECLHCFHAECIDEWLRQNASCPVCRNSSMSSPLKHPV